MSNRLIVVVGSGPGLGTKVPTYFVSQGFNGVALLSRNAQRLKDDAAAVSKGSGNSNINVKTYSVDTGDSNALEATLKQVEADQGKPEVVLFNAARIANATIGEEPVESVLQDLKVMTVGLYVTASWALPLLSGTHPCFFLTGGSIHNNPWNQVFSLSLNKAAQVNFMGSLAQVANPKGIHVATVDIGGVVKDDDPVLSAENIAKKFWELYEQDGGQWQEMITVGNIRELIDGSQ